MNNNRKSSIDNKSEAKWFAQQVLSWGQVHGRRHFPWQHPHNPYKTWISEIMLQQTQTSRVVDFFNAFIQTFPDINSLAKAQEDAIFHLWSGLGYYTRAQNILKSAQILAQHHNCTLPKSLDQLIALPGIGRSTAGAIRSLGHGLAAPILDGNVRRILGRFARVQGKPQSRAMENMYWTLAEQLTPGQARVDREFNQSMMDLGATICTPKNPLCSDCPLRSKCQAYAHQQTDHYPITLAKYKKNQALPVSSRRKKVCYLLFMQNSNAILLEKRPPLGIWRNLWCPQEFCSMESLEAVAIGYSKKRLKLMPEFQHQFSHFDLLIHPVVLNLTDLQTQRAQAQIHEPKRFLWYNLHNPPNIGLASPVITLLESLRTTQQSPA